MSASDDTALMATAKSATLLSSVRFVLGTGGVYLGFSLLNRAIPFLLLPLLTRHIDPAGFGVVTIVSLITMLLMPVVGLCGNSVLYQRYYKLSELERVCFINDTYKIILLVGALLAILLPLIYPLLANYIRVGLGWVEVAVIAAISGMISTVTLALFQIRGDALKYGLFQSVSVTSNVVLTIILVVLFDLSWEGRIWAIVASSIVMSVGAVYLNLRAGDLRVDLIRDSGQIKTIVLLGSALIPGSMIGWAITMSDRVFLTTMTSLETVGIYAVGITIGQITNIVLGAVGQACIPYLYRYGPSDDQQIRVRIVQGIYLLIIISLAVAAMVTGVSPFIFDVFVDHRYHDALRVVGWISAAYVFMNIGATLQSLILAVEKNKITMFLSGITLLANLISNYVCIKQFGMVGAAMGNAFSTFTFMLVAFLASLRFNCLPWLDPRVLRLPASIVSSK